MLNDSSGKYKLGKMDIRKSRNLGKYNDLGEYILGKMESRPNGK